MKVNVKRFITTNKFGVTLFPLTIYNAEVVDNGRYMIFLRDYLAVLVENRT